MSRSMIAILGIIILVAMSAGLWFWLKTTVASSEKVTSVARVIKAVDKNVLRSELVVKIKSREVNGSIPVKLNSAELGRSDPFAK